MGRVITVNKIDICRVDIAFMCPCPIMHCVIDCDVISITLAECVTIVYHPQIDMNAAVYFVQIPILLKNIYAALVRIILSIPIMN